MNNEKQITETNVCESVTVWRHEAGKQNRNMSRMEREDKGVESLTEKEKHETHSKRGRSDGVSPMGTRIGYFYFLSTRSFPEHFPVLRVCTPLCRPFRGSAKWGRGWPASGGRDMWGRARQPGGPMGITMGMGRRGLAHKGNITSRGVCAVIRTFNFECNAVLKKTGAPGRSFLEQDVHTSRATRRKIYDVLWQSCKFTQSILPDAANTASYCHFLQYIAEHRASGFRILAHRTSSARNDPVMHWGVSRVPKHSILL